MSSENPPESFAEEQARELRRRLSFSDRDLIDECEVHRHRVSGPGGQHRNKVASAIRLVHQPSGLTVTGTERRSQHENQANALKRLREALALYVRVPLPTAITWPPRVQIRDRRLRVSQENPGYCHVLALALDALHAANGSPKDAAAALGVTTSSFTRFLADNDKAWTEANRMRHERGQPPLRP